MLVCLMVIGLSVSGLSAEADKTLTFKNGEFKILVLTDTQDDAHPAYDMLNLVRKSIAETQPDLIVFTGDLVEDSRIGDIGIDSEPFREGVVVENIRGEINMDKTLPNILAATDAILSIMQESGIPFALAQGNNDYKVGIDTSEWLEIYSQYSNCLVTDMSDDSDGRIDYNLPIYNSEGEMVFNIWMMDTGRGGVYEDQLEWYKKASAEITSANGGVVPALAFQHIYTSDIGNLFEECSVTTPDARAIGTKYYHLNPDIAHGFAQYAYEPGYTSDEFLAWKECGDVIGAFFGHQHFDGFSGVVDGIELGFTYGAEMAKKGPYGFRLITLHEEDVRCYDNALYTYEGRVLLGTDRFELQDETPYNETNFFLRMVAVMKNFFRLVFSFFASL